MGAYIVLPFMGYGTKKWNPSLALGVASRLGHLRRHLFPDEQQGDWAHHPGHQVARNGVG